MGFREEGDRLGCEGGRAFGARREKPLALLEGGTKQLEGFCPL